MSSLEKTFWLQNPYTMKLGQWLNDRIAINGNNLLELSVRNLQSRESRENLTSDVIRIQGEYAICMEILNFLNAKEENQ
jgi:hypothetical protein